MSVLVNYEKKDKKSIDNVLNGIAYDRRRDRFYITGKNWENLYYLKFK